MIPLFSFLYYHCIITLLPAAVVEYLTSSSSSPQVVQTGMRLSPSSSSFRLLRKCTSTYNWYAAHRPYRTNILSGGVLGFIGDQICQRVIETEDDGVSWRRSFAITTFCAYYQGGVDTLIYALYHRMRIPFRASKTAFGRGMMISLFDNLIHVPLLYTPAFYTTLGLLQQHTIKETMDTMRREYLPTITLCWGMWIPLQFINFTLVPLRYQVLFVNVSCLLWNVCLDYVAHGGFTSHRGGGDDDEFIHKCHSHCDHDRPVSYLDIQLHTHHNRGESWSS
uniref:Peroxisomal membrane protein 2 n=1 Tax=Perkinsus olseni TaxID=32597 RepID=A0A2K8DQT4_PEROL|nr:Peroxisomal membrane protein 2 [Perkinsus olseni]